MLPCPPLRLPCQTTNQQTTNKQTNPATKTWEGLPSTSLQISLNYFNVNRINFQENKRGASSFCLGKCVRKSLSQNGPSLQAGLQHTVIAASNNYSPAEQKPNFQAEQVENK